MRQIRKPKDTENILFISLNSVSYICSYICVYVHIDICTHTMKNICEPFQIGLNIYPPNRYLSSACYVSSTILGAGNVAASKTYNTVCPMALTLQQGEAESG